MLALERRDGMLADPARLEEGEAVEDIALCILLGEVMLLTAEAHLVQSFRELIGVAVEIDVNLVLAFLIQQRFEREGPQVQMILMRVGDKDMAQIGQVKAEARAGSQNIRTEIDENLLGYTEARAQADFLAALLSCVFAHRAAAERGGDALRPGSQKLQSQFIHEKADAPFAAAGCS